MIAAIASAQVWASSSRPFDIELPTPWIVGPAMASVVLRPVNSPAILAASAADEAPPPAWSRDGADRWFDVDAKAAS